MRTAFLRALEYDDKGDVLRTLSAESSVTVSTSRFDVECSQFRDLPNSAFAYWISDNIRSLFQGQARLDEHGVVAKQGLATADDFRFVRLRWEVAPGEDRWATFAKGGPLSPFYADISEVVLWGKASRQIRTNLNAAGTVRSNIWMLRSTEQKYFERPGLTWPVRASRFSPRALPSGCVFSHRGYSAFMNDDDRLFFLAVFNSSTFDYLFKIALGRFGFPEFLVGLLPQVPAPAEPSSEVRRVLEDQSVTAWRLRRWLHSGLEVSESFLAPFVLQVAGGALDERVRAYVERTAAISGTLADAQRVIDELCFDLYGVTSEDRHSIEEGFAAVDDQSDSSDEDGARGLEEQVVEPDARALASDLVSWCVGVGIGRFDVRLATGERQPPGEPGPFDSLPVCSPGMLIDDDGLPVATPPTDYEVEISPLLVDDTGHPLDMTARVRSVFDVEFGHEADRWWSDVGEALGAKGREVGSWLSKGFFDYHLKMYSKSRRKAPIYWPLGTGSGSYLVWLYAHRVTRDSLLRVLNDVVTPKLALEQRRLSDAVQEAGPNPSASHRKTIEGQEKLVDELQEFVDELTAVAPLWHPDLNDGIVVVLAPLWKLFAHHKSWSKELGKHWGSLTKGEYDWAQLAMRLWPERVVPKCAEDRSLAIAHGLEDVFWVQDEENPDKWHPRENPTLTVEQLIADRSDPAIQAALEDT